jgi:hypothetical protein
VFRAAETVIASGDPAGFHIRQCDVTYIGNPKIDAGNQDRESKISQVTYFL